MSARDLHAVLGPFTLYDIDGIALAVRSLVDPSPSWGRNDDPARISMTDDRKVVVSSPTYVGLKRLATEYGVYKSVEISLGPSDIPAIRTITKVVVNGMWQI